MTETRQNAYVYCTGNVKQYVFYPRDAMLAWVFATATCLSVRLSVCLDVCHTPVLCLAERKQDREMYIVRHLIAP